MAHEGFYARWRTWRSESVSYNVLTSFRLDHSDHLKQMMSRSGISFRELYPLFPVGLWQLLKVYIGWFPHFPEHPWAFWQECMEHNPVKSKNTPLNPNLVCPPRNVWRWRREGVRVGAGCLVGGGRPLLLHGCWRQLLGVAGGPSSSASRPVVCLSRTRRPVQLTQFFSDTYPLISDLGLTCQPRR